MTNLARVLAPRLLLLLGLLSLPVVGATPAWADATSTTAVEPRGVRMSSGGLSAVSYVAKHAFSGEVAPGDPLDGLFIATDDPSMRGAWADAGFTAAWMAPEGLRQLEPRNLLVRNAYYSAEVSSSPFAGATSFQAGDEVDVAIAGYSWNTPATPDRPRGEADGTLAWEHSVDVRTIEARYGSSEGTLDVVLIQGHIVARGGDVDARRAPIPMPPLVLDLPRLYPGQVAVTGGTGTNAPYFDYVDVAAVAASPTTGKVTLNATVTGYIPEAADHEAGDVALHEWAIPIQAVVLIDPSDDLAGLATMSLPAGGEAFLGLGDEARRVTVPAGGKVLLGSSGEASVLSDAEPPPAAPPGGSSIGETLAAAAIDRQMTEPTELTLGDDRFSMTIDPDFRDEGVLGLHSVRRIDRDRTLAGAASVPFATTGGLAQRLTRSRLLDLSVVPTSYGGIGGSGTVRGDPEEPLDGVAQDYTRNHAIGAQIEAVYLVAGQQFLHVSYDLAPAAAPPDRFLMTASVRSPSLPGFDTSAVLYLELPAPDGVALDGVTKTHEFSATRGKLTTGTHEAEVFSTVDVVRAGRPLTATPAADPQVALDGPTVGIYSTRGSSGASIDLLWPKYVAPPDPVEPDPKPLGQPCGDPQTPDDDVVILDPETDILSGWMDADDAFVYTTLQVRDVPIAATPGEPLPTYAFHWREYAHAKFTRATLTAAGTWRFDFGAYHHFFEVDEDNYHPLAEITGEVQPGPMGFIRLAVPRGLLDYREGDVLHDTAAYAWHIGQTLRAQTFDRAPNDAFNGSWGTGGDYTVGTC